MKIQHPPIRRHLLGMTKRDQKMRRSGRWNALIDQTNTTNLKKIVARIGWPTIPKVGPRVAHAAWLLAQHAVHDRPFICRCLRLMQSAPEGGVSASDIAYLKDRVLVQSGKRQIYGTQFHTHTHGGELFPYPILQPRRLDQRRHKVGLGTFSSYARRLKRGFEQWKRKTDRASRH